MHHKNLWDRTIGRIDDLPEWVQGVVFGVSFATIILMMAFL